MFSCTVFQADSEFRVSFSKKVDLEVDKVQVLQEGQGQKIIFFSESASKTIFNFVFGLKKKKKFLQFFFSHKGPPCWGQKLKCSQSKKKWAPAPLQITSSRNI